MMPENFSIFVSIDISKDKFNVFAVQNLTFIIFGCAFDVSKKWGFYNTYSLRLSFWYDTQLAFSNKSSNFGENSRVHKVSYESLKLSCLFFQSPSLFYNILPVVTRIILAIQNFLHSFVYTAEQKLVIIQLFGIIEIMHDRLYPFRHGFHYIVWMSLVNTG